MTVTFTQVPAPAPIAAPAPAPIAAPAPAPEPAAAPAAVPVAAAPPFGAMPFFPPPQDFAAFQQQVHGNLTLQSSSSPGNIAKYNQKLHLQKIYSDLNHGVSCLMSRSRVDDGEPRPSAPDDVVAHGAADDGEPRLDAIPHPKQPRHAGAYSAKS